MSAGASGNTDPLTWLANDHTTLANPSQLWLMCVKYTPKPDILSMPTVKTATKLLQVISNDDQTLPSLLCWVLG